MMKKTILTLAALAASTLVIGATSVSAQDVNKTYMRKGDQEIRVFTHEGKLFCRRTSDEFEMCFGMEDQGNGTWAGDQMRHPMMGKKIAFDGTVVIGSNGKMSIKGCQFGGAFCDSEIWDEVAN